MMFRQLARHRQIARQIKFKQRQHTSSNVKPNKQSAWHR
jgi:hypothetical protein